MTRRTSDARRGCGRWRRAWLFSPGVLGLLLVCGCGSAPASKASAPLPAAGKAPYDAPPASRASIEIALDFRAAREILESLSRPRLDASDPKLLEDLPAVRIAIADSQRTNDVFERDFAAAFAPEAHPAVFDLKSVRDGRDKLRMLLEAIGARQADWIAQSQRRAASLLPGDRPVTVKVQVLLTFGLAGIEDHLSIRAPGGNAALVIDFARALADTEGGGLDSQISRLSRLVAAEAFRQAWNQYREGSPAWTAADSKLGELEPLLKIVASAGPAGLFSVDENFFPLSTWLKEPMKRALDDLNQRADRITQAQQNLEERAALTSEIRRPDFPLRVGAPIGAFLADAIAQDAGPAGLRVALEKGPRAFFAAYDHAAQNDKTLIPLARTIRDKLK